MTPEEKEIERLKALPRKTRQDCATIVMPSTGATLAETAKAMQRANQLIPTGGLIVEIDPDKAIADGQRSEALRMNADERIVHARDDLPGAKVTCCGKPITKELLAARMGSPKIDCLSCLMVMEQTGYKFKARIHFTTSGEKPF